MTTTPSWEPVRGTPANPAAARREGRADTRRHRQVFEIAALVVAGRRERAGDLALVHTAEYPGDAALLADLLEPPRRPAR